MNLDSSLIQTRLQFCRSQSLTLLHHRTLESAISYAEKLNWCTSMATLTLFDTKMRFWHHTCCPQWISVGKFFSTTTLGGTMTSLQNQYLLCPPLACSTARDPSRHRLDQSTNMVLQNSPPFLLKSLQQFLQSLRRWLTTAHAAMEEEWWCEVPYPTPKNSTGAHP
jgi:23S rRNA A2030 N6-methylase RlmJ